jgi:glucose uptake protein
VLSASIGYISLVACILIMGSYLVPARRFSHCSPWYFQCLISLGVFVSTTLLALVMGRWTFSFLGLLAGVLWSIGSMLYLVAILWGILLFREIPGIRKRLRLLGYAVGLFAGAVLIGLAG